MTNENTQISATPVVSNGASGKREYTIDAKGKRLGIVATEAATYLLGKDQPDFAKNTVAPVTVTINNVSQLDMTEKKQGEIYQRYTGYPGGRREETFEHLAKRLGYAEPVKRTVQGMLPSNKLRAHMMKNLIINE
jgi:large subunit ribosomal protein L13